MLVGEASVTESPPTSVLSPAFSGKGHIVCPHPPHPLLESDEEKAEG